MPARSLLTDDPREEKRCDRSPDCGRDWSKKTNPSHLLLVAVTLIARGIAMGFQGLRALAMGARTLSDLNLERQQLVVIEWEKLSKFEAHQHHLNP